VSGVLVWAGVAVGSGLGALGRLLVDRAVRHTHGGFPRGILVVNLTGAFAIGVLDGLALPHDAALLASTAVVGSYTTFSTWMADTDLLLDQGRRTAALTNLLVSIGGGLAAVLAGLALTS
jgi:CrcB protein